MLALALTAYGCSDAANGGSLGGNGGNGGMGGVGGSVDPCEGGLGPCDPTGSSACVDEGGGAYSCVCNLGYAGMDCDECDDGYVDDPMSPGECIADPCDEDPCGIDAGSGESCTVDGPGAYTCTCDGNFDPDDDCGSCLAPFDGINCQCDTSMGETPDGMGGCTACVPAKAVMAPLPMPTIPRPPRRPIRTRTRSSQLAMSTALRPRAADRALVESEDTVGYSRVHARGTALNPNPENRPRVGRWGWLPQDSSPEVSSSAMTPVREIGA